MASADKPEDTEPDDKQAGAYPYLVLPLDERHQRREGKENQERSEKMAAH
jgi:hypothetical protein